MQASMKLGEAMYQAQQGPAGSAPEAPADDGVVDAEFEDVSRTTGSRPDRLIPRVLRAPADSASVRGAGPEATNWTGQFEILPLTCKGS